MIRAIARKWRALFALSLLSIVALPFESVAQGVGVSGPAYSRGNLLRKPEYQTYAALNLFVDASTGNDNSPCTSSSVPCLTFQGAVDKIPKLVRHPVTVTSADGTYATAGLTINGFRFDPANVTNGAYLKFQGAYKAFVPATGTATGTATAGTAGSGAGAVFGTLTDGAQTWTTNNLRGQIIEITGGTGSGQFRVIEGNTGTVITVVGTWTAPTGTSTYAIRDWGTVITGGTAQSALPGVAAGLARSVQISGNSVTGTATTSSQIYFDKIRIAPAVSTTVGLGMFGGASQLVYLNQVSIVGGATNAISLTNSQGGSIRTDTSFFSSSASATINFGSTVRNTSIGAHAMNNTMLLNTGTGAGTAAMSGAYNGFTITSSEFRVTGASAVVAVSITNQTSSTTCTTCRFECASGSTTSVGISINVTTFSPSTPTWGLSGIGVNNCVTAIEMIGPSHILSNVTQNIYANATNGVSVSKGALYDLQAADTFSTVTNEIVIDGVVYTAAAINALSPPLITNLGYASRVGR